MAWPAYIRRKIGHLKNLILSVSLCFCLCHSPAVFCGSAIQHCASNPQANHTKKYYTTVSQVLKMTVYSSTSKGKRAKLKCIVNIFKNMKMTSVIFLLHNMFGD